jgi:hypothetical protein
MYYHLPHPDAPHTLWVPELPPGKTPEDLPRIATAEVKRLVDRMETGASFWRDDPLDDLRHVRVVGTLPQQIRDAWAVRKDSGDNAPMPAVLADALARRAISTVPSSTAAPAHRPVFEHVLIPVYLAVVFDGALSLAPRLAKVSAYFPEVAAARDHLIAPNASLLNRRYGSGPVAPYPPEAVGFRGGVLAWITDALMARGGEVTAGHMASAAYMAGNNLLALSASAWMAEEVLTRDDATPQDKAEALVHLFGVNHAAPTC